MEPKNHRTLVGTVEKLSSAQTIRVVLKVTKTHPLYRKRYTLSKHYLVHDEAGTAAIGDTVTIAMCKPVSKNKHWTVVAK